MDTNKKNHMTRYIKYIYIYIYSLIKEISNFIFKKLYDQIFISTNLLFIYKKNLISSFLLLEKKKKFIR